MLIPGLVSVTFRDLPPERIVELAREAGLRSIEWGGDVHVPHGNLEAARSVARLTSDAGLEVSAYGSYYSAAFSESEGLGFDSVCETAIDLGAPVIRVWAGRIGSASADVGTRQRVIDDLRRISASAAADGVEISLEFHGGTLSDTPESAVQLLDEISEKTRHGLETRGTGRGTARATCYWQPPNGVSQEECARGLRLMLPDVRNIHVFHWWPDHEHRLPLETGADHWREYFGILSQMPVRRHASLEFVANGDIAQFKKDAVTLHALLAGTENSKSKE